MNIARRKNIALVIAEIQNLSEKMKTILEDIEIIMDEEEKYRANIPKNLQGSDRYSAAEEAIDNLGGAYVILQGAFDSLDSVVPWLEEASQ